MNLDLAMMTNLPHMNVRAQVVSNWELTPKHKFRRQTGSVLPLPPPLRPLAPMEAVWPKSQPGSRLNLVMKNFLVVIRPGAPEDLTWRTVSAALGRTLAKTLKTLLIGPTSTSAG